VLGEHADERAGKVEHAPEIVAVAALERHALALAVELAADVDGARRSRSSSTTSAGSSWSSPNASTRSRTGPNL